MYYTPRQKGGALFTLIALFVSRRRFASSGALTIQHTKRRRAVEPAHDLFWRKTAKHLSLDDESGTDGVRCDTYQEMRRVDHRRAQHPRVVEGLESRAHGVGDCELNCETSGLNKHCAVETQALFKYQQRGVKPMSTCTALPR